MIEDHELWVHIEGFPDYTVSSFGRVRSEATGRIIQPSATSRGGYKVGLMFKHKQYTRSVKNLVAAAFLPGADEIFDTAINLDGDKTNNDPRNLAWRPRWFAIMYARQFNEEYDHLNRGPILDVGEDITYENVYSAAVTNGLLFREVFSSSLNEEAVFPTWQIFRWLH